VDADADQRWPTCLRSLLAFSVVSVLFLYGFQRLQQHLLLSCRAHGDGNPVSGVGGQHQFL
jgi:K+-transporting ATPase A subunit